MFDAKVVRKDFPVLERRMNGDVPLVYLDSAASTQRPRSVIDTMSAFEEHSYANVHRGVYQLADEATQAFEGARSAVARFLDAESPKEIVFTRGTTESLNLIANSWGRTNLREGDEIVTTEMEHHSNLVPWQMITQVTGAKLVAWPVTDDGRLDPDRSPITEKTKVVSVTAMSNVLGTINDIAAISAEAHAVGALVVVDGAQAVPHVKLSVQEMGADVVAFSGHKMLGPTGSGGLWARRELLEEMPPFLGGGEMILEVYLDRSTYNEVPYKFEAGTPAITPQVGLGAAIEYLEALGMDAVREHEKELTRYALDQLSGIKGIRLFGPDDVEMRGGVVSFWFDDLHPHDLAQVLDTHGICVRAGHHCAQLLMRRYGVPATTRASFYVYNTPEDVDALVKGIDAAHHTMGI